MGYDYANKAVYQDNLNNLTNYANSIRYFNKSDSIFDLGYVLTDYSAALCLWKVNDESTKDYMISFYSELVNTNNINKSLKFAMQKTKEKYSHPYYWAPFVHIE